jgi:uncharacterized protein with HEPN domain
MQKPEEAEKKIIAKRSLEEVDQIDTSKEEGEEKKVSKVEKEKPKKPANAETLSVISENLFLIEDIAKFIGDPNIPKDKRGQYCIQLNMAVMGEAARNVIRLLEQNEEYMPRSCNEMPWDKLLYLRTACSHKAHLQDLEQLIKAIRADIPGLRKIANKMMTLIKNRQHEKKEHEQEPLELAAIEAYIKHIKEIEKKKKEEKSKDESRKDENIDKLSKQVKGLKIIIDELNNIQAFLKVGNDDVTIYAIQMAIVRAGLAISDRLDNEFQEKNQLQLAIPGRTPLTWKSLIRSREQTIHANYKVNAQQTLTDAKAFQSAYHFINNLYERQNANLMKLKTEFHQKQQPEKPLGLRESEKEKTVGSYSQTTALAEAEPFKGFSLKLKAMPKIKATGFIKPSASPSLSVSGTISAKQSNSSDVKEDPKPSSSPGKKI